MFTAAVDITLNQNTPSEILLHNIVVEQFCEVGPVTGLKMAVPVVQCHRQVGCHYARARIQLVLIGKNLSFSNASW